MIKKLILLALLLYPTEQLFATAPTTANLWVDSNGGTCTRQSSAGAYSDAGACGTIDAAWDAASVGDVIVIKSGTYSGETISGNKTTPGAHIYGESTTTLGDMTISANFAYLEDITIDVSSAHSDGLAVSGNDVTIKNVKLHGSYVRLQVSGDRFSWLGGELGTSGVTGGQRNCANGDSEPSQFDGADDALIDSVAFWKQNYDGADPTCGVDNRYHLEMVRIDSGGSNFTMRNSYIEPGDHADTSSIFLTNPSGGATYSGLKLENNRIGDSEAFSAISVHSNVSTCSAFKFAYNTFGNLWISVDGCGTRSNWEVVGNAGIYTSFHPCFNSGTNTHVKNVWQWTQTITCGSDTTVVDADDYSTSALGLNADLTLAAGSALIDAAETNGASDYCTDAAKLNSVDYRGYARPVNSTCDAGADEYGASGGGSTTHGTQKGVTTTKGAVTIK